MRCHSGRLPGWRTRPRRTINLSTGNRPRKHLPRLSHVCLRAARVQLKRRMLTMVSQTLQAHGLPNNFADRVGRLIEVRGNAAFERVCAERHEGVAAYDGSRPARERRLIR
jgi:hypothetical protein